MANLNINGIETEQEILGSAPDASDLTRQRRLAELLMAKGAQQPKGDMVSGYYVAPSWTQQLAPMLNMAMGIGLDKNADGKQKEIAAALRATKAEETKAIKEAIKAKDWATASELVDTSTTGAGKQYAALLANKLVPEDQKPQVVAPGGSLVDASGNVIYKAPFKPEGGGGMGGAMALGGEGMFNKKGDFIAPGGAYFSKSEIAKDRAVIDAAKDLSGKLEKLNPEDIKKTDSLLGDVTQGGVKGWFAKQTGNTALSAQVKVNAAGIMQTLQNLPPGPASDKDIMQAKSTFPGYGDAVALQEWVDRTKDTLQTKVYNTNSKYGTDAWYGANGTGMKQPAAPAGGGDLAAAAAAELARRKGGR